MLRCCVCCIFIGLVASVTGILTGLHGFIVVSSAVAQTTPNPGAPRPAAFDPKGTLSEDSVVTMNIDVSKKAIEEAVNVIFDRYREVGHPEECPIMQCRYSYDISLETVKDDTEVTIHPRGHVSISLSVKLSGFLTFREVDMRNNRNVIVDNNRRVEGAFVALISFKPNVGPKWCVHAEPTVTIDWSQKPTILKSPGAEFFNSTFQVVQNKVKQRLDQALSSKETRKAHEALCRTIRERAEEAWTRYAVPLELDKNRTALRQLFLNIEPRSVHFAEIKPSHDHVSLSVRFTSRTWLSVSDPASVKQQPLQLPPLRRTSERKAGALLHVPAVVGSAELANLAGQLAQCQSCWTAGDGSAVFNSISQTNASIENDLVTLSFTADVPVPLVGSCRYSVVVRGDPVKVGRTQRLALATSDPKVSHVDQHLAARNICPYLNPAREVKTILRDKLSIDVSKMLVESKASIETQLNKLNEQRGIRFKFNINKPDFQDVKVFESTLVVYARLSGHFDIEITKLPPTVKVWLEQQISSTFRKTYRITFANANLRPQLYESPGGKTLNITVPPEIDNVQLEQCEARSYFRWCKVSFKGQKGLVTGWTHQFALSPRP